MILFFVFLASYLLGSIPFGVLLMRQKGIDVRQVGSGNIGATNVLRTGHKRIAAYTLLLDALKGFLPVFLFLQITGALGCTENQSILASFLALTTVLGHVFPLWSHFKGGKGVATAMGTLWALNWILALVLCFLWVSFALLFRISSLAALVAALAAPVIAWGLWHWGYGSSALVVYAGALVLLLLWTHHQNISNLLKGREKTVL